MSSNLGTIDYQKKWSYSLFFFAFPPLILLMTSIVILSMGYQGEMWGMKPSKISFALALSFFIWSLISLIKLSIQLKQTIKHLHQYSQLNIQGKSVRLLNTSFPYAAQVGFWQSELLVSQGLIELLSPEHLSAVISHETAHQKHRDTLLINYRLQERIDALIDTNESISQFNWSNLIWLILIFIPWITIPYQNSI